MRPEARPLAPHATPVSWPTASPPLRPRPPASSPQASKAAGPSGKELPGQQAQADDAAAGGGGPSGWVPLRTVAQLRRERGVGAPRNSDSLYKPVERAPKKFNPLRIPLSLQVRARNERIGCNC